MAKGGRTATPEERWWTKPRLKCLVYTFENSKTNDEQAEEFEITDRAVKKWKAHPFFKKKLAEMQAKAGEAAQEVAITNRQKRNERYDKRWNQLGDANDVKLDPALLREERELAKQAAIDNGQWQERHQHDFTKLTDAELLALARAKGVIVGSDAPGLASDDEDDESSR